MNGALFMTKTELLELMKEIPGDAVIVLPGIRYGHYVDCYKVEGIDVVPWTDRSNNVQYNHISSNLDLYIRAYVIRQRGVE